MRQFLTVVAFALLTIGLFAAYSNYGIPQLEPAPPPTEEKLDLAAMDMEQFIAVGEEIFTGKGTCTLCHNELGRAPTTEAIAEAAPTRLDDPRYEGEAGSVEEYLSESLVDPSAFVVAGFGKTGTNDTESPMPSVVGGSIGLSEAELAAVVAYLQDLSGLEVTVAIPTEKPEEAAAEAEEVAEAEPREAMLDPMELVSEYACDACHMIGGEGGDIGPDLAAIGATRDRDYLRRALLDPNADIAEGFEEDMMPPDLGDQLYASELEILVDFLAGSK